MHILHPRPVTFFNIAHVVRQFPLLDQASAVPNFGRRRFRIIQPRQDVIDIFKRDVREIEELVSVE